MNKIKNNFSLLTLLIVMVLSSSCAAPKHYKTFSLNYNQSQSTTEISKNIEIKITPVTIPNIKEHDALLAKTKYGFSFGNYIIPNVVTVCDLPAFEIEMTNKTGHVIKFPGNVLIKAQDINGKIYESESVYSLLNGISKWAEMEKEAGIYWDMKPVRDKISNINILDQNTTLLPGIPHHGYLMFNFPTNSRDEYIQFMDSTSQLKVLIFELPISMDKAGKSIKTQNITFVYNIKANEVTPQ